MVKKMDKNVKPLLDEVENGLKLIFDNKLTNIILYGSYARGNYDEESDIDIIALVEEKELKKYNDQVIDLEIDLTIKYGIMPSILLENKEYFTKNKNVEYLFQNVEKYGKTIYAA
jgi:predicted nucleotidyltransferase